MSPHKRVLITGIGSFWGGRVAQTLEADPSVEVLVGLDTQAPNVELERTEYVPVDNTYSALSRLVRDCGIDTIVHTFLVVDPTQMSKARLHDINVIGTMNLFAAAAAPGSRVKSVVVKSSALYYGCAPEDPVWFTEDAPEGHRPRSVVRRSLHQVESYVTDFAADNPEVSVAILRFSNVLGPEISTPFTRALQMPMVPSVLGFDPRLQFVHEDDVIDSLLFALSHDLSGAYNVAGDGLLPWSEVVALCGKHRFPLPPVATDLLTSPFHQVGLVDLPVEYLTLLKYGRGLDNAKLKGAGFRYRYTSSQAVDAFIQALRVRNVMGAAPAYRYERDVEQFFRHSPAVLRNRPGSPDTDARQ